MYNLQRKQNKLIQMPNHFIFILFLGWKVFLHPFYISLTDIRYNSASKTLEISQKIFWDDLEVALSDINKGKIDFLNPKDTELLARLVENYLIQHNEISINGQVLKLNYLGFEIEEDAAWFYLEAQKVPVPKTITVKNTVLVDRFAGQQNIVNIYQQQKPKSLILEKNKTSGTITLSK
jgi:hypothetical protein